MLIAASRSHSVAVMQMECMCVEVESAQEELPPYGVCMCRSPATCATDDVISIRKFDGVCV